MRLFKNLYYEKSGPKSSSVSSSVKSTELLLTGSATGVVVVISGTDTIVGAGAIVGCSTTLLGSSTTPFTSILIAGSLLGRNPHHSKY